MVEEEFTEAEAKEIVRNLSEAKESTTSFFTKVVKADSTIRTGNLTDDELGISNHPVRTYKELELFCRKIASDDSFADYFKELAEVQTGTSLSRGGFLLKQVTSSRKEIADMTPKRKKNKGMFKKKDEKEEE